MQSDIIRKDVVNEEWEYFLSRQISVFGWLEE